MFQKRPLGYWVLTIMGVFLLFELVIGQAMSFIDYDLAVSMGLQEPKDIISAIGVAFNKGFGVGDTAVYIPLLLAGLIGMWLKRPWGAFAMFGAMAITAYWPVVCMFFLLFASEAPDFHFTSFVTYAVIMGIALIYGLWGMWYSYRSRALSTKE